MPDGSNDGAALGAVNGPDVGHAETRGLY